MNKYIQIPIKDTYFSQILIGRKKEEYREINYHWSKELQKEPTHILFVCGRKNMLVEYLGYEIKEIKHEFFNNKPTKVFAIKLGNIIQSNI